jgi:hypothetical protein
MNLGFFLLAESDSPAALRERFSARLLSRPRCDSSGFPDA